ncbi:hypothetical protein P7D85_16460 [Enterococcus hulanensis]|uniref:HTH merR-type domain-containing protein n=1 Tax=Enterococcus hulanensis TaxID=2559929 RepID=A0ABU3F4I0_9ENTE|nr:hypothetical protein [Enterococcus hulanensis]MDT2601383.1 hypothetical protein [Enterococcus hulanensis]MDT2611074.1 hypothetical protein [Enterococcus hulanensis]MDT2618479.1 hypothetical protein [Enterococcus hulanensis]MDT2629318.1 hypothetical protein [Enterococcus hulanensis]MDT2656880.1 hypothetical protein [Enterococcus hulanensis]
MEEKYQTNDLLSITGMTRDTLRHYSGILDRINKLEEFHQRMKKSRF